MTMSEGGGGLTSGSPSEKQDIMLQLRLFVEGATKDKLGNLRVSNIALNLLKNLPSARDAVFEYYAGILERIVNNYNPESPDSSTTPEEEEIISEVQETLSGYIESNPSSWAPMVSKWSLDTLGRLTQQYGSKMMPKGKSEKGKVVGVAGSLHERVSCWLGCIASRFLIQISAECLSKQMDDDSEGCISSLLETSVTHAPYFDWVVAHLGSCFPSTIINRILILGLKEYVSLSSGMKYKREPDSLINLQKVPKLNSVVNILSHLGRNHQDVLQESMHNLFLSSISDDSNSTHQTGTVPYLLQLAEESSHMARALLAGLVDVLTPQVLDRLETLHGNWKQVYFTKENSLLETVTHILLSTDSDIPEILLLLLEKGGEGVATPRGEGGRDSDTSKACRMIFNHVLATMFQQVHGSSRHRGEGVPALQSIHANVSVYLDLLLSRNRFLRCSSAQLLALVALHKGRAFSIQVVRYLLYNCSTDTELLVLSDFLPRVEIFHYNIVPDLISQCLRSRDDRIKTFLSNVLRIVTAENSKNSDIRSSFISGLRSEQMLLAERLLQPENALNVLTILRIVGINTKLRISHVHRLCHCFVQLYFSTLIDKEMDSYDRDKILHLSELLMSELCDQRFGLQILLRFLLEASVNSAYSVYLGGGTKGDVNSMVTGKPANPPNPPSSTNIKKADTAKLFRENLKFGSMPVQPLGSSTVFHAGIIGGRGGGGKNAVARRGGVGTTVAGEVETCAETEMELREHVTGVLLRLCRACGDEDEGYKKLALQLVEMVSPDIMYNGIPWPEEEFIKVTMERDLDITRTLESNPILWNLLDLLARHKPALSYCSVLVRGVMSVCISHWQSTAASRLANYPAQISLTQRVITLMGVGQFIPGHLALVAQVIHILDPAQLNCILVDMWNYMRSNVPGPSSYSVCHETGQVYRNFGTYSDFKPYCDRLRMVMLANLEKVADLFKIYFVDSVKKEHLGGTIQPTVLQNHVNGTS
eukprot:TRINITY_DN1817_c0_g1_i3.p1 TRINITY_DN1817_c0_g1~~TRINITY_DN1817_c0_g1_i3.p1  ORF type:complete len:989 (+),score=197.31 TRINITY_DN1817_c0_g1_i3:38-3004(+)